MVGHAPQGESGFGIQWANMSPLPDEPSLKRRKVRKGTHSCWECRSRKIKCLYDSPDDPSCITCRKRGSECVSQVDSAAPSESTERNARMGFVGDKSAFVVNQGSSATSITTHAYAPLTPESRASPLPLVPRGGVRDALLCTIPSQHDIRLLMDEVGPRPALDYRFCNPITEQSIDPRLAVAALLSPNSHPVLLARQMLRFAAALQSIPNSQTIPSLSQHQSETTKRVMDTVIKEVNSNDNLLGTLEGFDNLISETLWHVDCGHLRRAWISLRRAVMVAQLLGLDRPGSRRYKVLDRHEYLDADAMYEYVVRVERVLSLLLGLPTSTNGLNLGQSLHDEVVPAAQDQMTIGMSGIIVKVLARNQLGATPQNLEMTRTIDRDLIVLAESMPLSYWQPLSFTGLEPASMQANNELRRGFAHACFHSMIIQLHLSLLLNPCDAKQRTYSKMACASASRELLSKAIVMHSVYPSSRASGRMMHDFLAAIAGLTLMLAHATSHHNEDANLLRHQRATDRAAVQRAVECIQSMREEREEALALKCATLLQDLLIVEDEIAKERNRPEAAAGVKSRSILVIKVPYIGHVTISHKGVVMLTPAVAEQLEESDEDVTIGGLGSIRASYPNTPGHEERESDCDAQISATSQPMCCAAPRNLSSGVETGQHNLAMQKETMFPDAAAGLDDWTFQGLDTAFFDSLMRGSNDPLPDASLQQSIWDTRTTWPGRHMDSTSALPDT